MTLYGKVISKAGYFLGVEYAPMPSTIFLTVNSRCNLKCSMCDVGTGDKNSQFWQNMIGAGDMPPAVIKKLVDEIKLFRPLLAITSTEPLLYDPLNDVISYAAAAGIRVQVTTNGLLLPKKANGLLKAGLSSLWVSIDGPRSVHDRMRGANGSFEKALKGLEIIFESRTTKLREVSVNCSITPLNQGSIVELLEILSNFPVDMVSVSHMNYITEEMAERHNAIYASICKATPACVGELDPSLINPGILWAEIQEIEKRKWPFRVAFSPMLDSEKEIVAYYNEPSKIVAKRACSIPWEQAQITANGDLTIMTRCFHLTMGNLREKTFNELWNGEQMRSFRRELHSAGMFPACSRCCGVL